MRQEPPSISRSIIFRPGSSDRHRLLEDHADPVAADLRTYHASLPGRSRQMLAVEGQDLAGTLESVRDSQRGLMIDRLVTLLPQPRFADEAHDLAAVDVEVDAVDRAHDTVAREERRAEAWTSAAAVARVSASAGDRAAAGTSSSMTIGSPVGSTGSRPRPTLSGRGGRRDVPDPVIGSASGRAHRAARRRGG